MPPGAVYQHTSTDDLDVRHRHASCAGDGAHGGCVAQVLLWGVEKSGDGQTQDELLFVGADVAGEAGAVERGRGSAGGDRIGRALDARAQLRVVAGGTRTAGGVGRAAYQAGVAGVGA
jgi:hypothetical protein